MTVTEEWALPFSVPRHKVPLVSLYRSTWVTSSVRALDNRGLLPAYEAQLASADREPLLYCLPASWLEAPLVSRHYEACDRLGLSNDTLIDIGADVTRRVHASALSLGRSLAMASGVTPWAILERLDKLWIRALVGGAVAVARLGPKEARVEIAGFPLAEVRYNRIATRGIVHGIVQMFCHTAWVHEITPLCTRTTLGYRLQWA